MPPKLTSSPIGTEGLNVRLRMDGLTGLAREMMADIGTAA